MSNRWYILVFSIIFLFVFRIWINDLRFDEMDSTVHNTSQTGDISTETFTPPTYHSMSTIDLGSNSWFDNAKLTGNNNQYLYIFPAWPDTLVYTFEQVFVNHNMVDQTNPQSILKNVDY